MTSASDQFTEEEIELGKRIYDQLLSLQLKMSSRQLQNLKKKMHIQEIDQTPELIYLEAARKLLIHYSNNLKEDIKRAAEAM